MISFLHFVFHTVTVLQHVIVSGAALKVSTKSPVGSIFFFCTFNDFFSVFQMLSVSQRSFLQKSDAKKIQKQNVAILADSNPWDTSHQNFPFIYFVFHEPRFCLWPRRCGIHNIQKSVINCSDRQPMVFATLTNTLPPCPPTYPIPSVRFEFPLFWLKTKRFRAGSLCTAVVKPSTGRDDGCLSTVSCRIRRDKSFVRTNIIFYLVGHPIIECSVINVDTINGWIR